MSATFEPIIGRYMHLDLFGRPHRIYVEEAGEGTPLLCLHTAGSRRAAIPRADERCAGHLEASRHRLRHALARQVVAAGRLARRGISAHLGAIHHHGPGDFGRARTRPADPDRLLDRRPHRAASGARTPRTFPRHHRPAGRRACRSLLRSQFPAPERRARRRGRRRHRLRPGRPRCAGQASAGKRCGTTCRAAPASSRAICISTSSTATSAAASRRSTRGAARCFCCQANTIIPARRRRRLAVANSIAGCEVTIMKGLGHFPMSEDPQAFLTHLLPVLEKIGRK